MASIQEYIKEWMQLGYTDEQSEELARLSVLGSVGDIKAHVADKTLYRTLKEYELKEGNSKNEDNGVDFK